VKNKNTPALFFFFLILSLPLFSQGLELSALTIPPALKENANAVVRDCVVDVTILSVDKMIVKEKRIVTVLNKLGNVDVKAFAYYDNDTKVTKISAIIYDVLGAKIKKYSKSKFKDVSAVDGSTLYSDSRVLYLNYVPTSYPYTVVFESEYKTSSTGFIPKWMPLEGYLVSIEKSSYHLIDEAKIPIRKKEKNFKGYPIKNTSTAFELNYRIENQKAIKPENSSVSYLTFQPQLLVVLENFSLKGVLGSAKNWKEFGKWMYDYLISGRDVLDEATKNEIKELVKNAKNDIEKAKIVYQFMQNKTRYISVQVGIGGWEPIAANEVDKMGYGDCKGLTNYTKALLDVVGVKSNFTLVFAKNQRDIDKDFASLQGNHAILNIPNNGKDIWLECTSQIMPFGFLGDFTDDRNVLVITPEGGVIKRTPKYVNQQNLQTLKAQVVLDEKGDVNATVTIVSKGIQYDRVFAIESEDKEDLIKYYKQDVWDYNNNLEVNTVALKNDKEAVVFTQKLSLFIQDYATINQQDYLFRVNVFNKNSYVPKRYRHRKLPLKIARGFKDVDEYEFTTPKGFVVGNLPKIAPIETKFGSYKISFKKQDDTHFTYRKELLIKAGVYPKEDYKLYRKFRKKIKKLENLRIILTKKQ